MVRDDLLLRAQLDDFMKSCFGFSWSLSRFKWNFTIILQHDVISVVCRGIAWFHSLPFLVTGPAAALAGKGVSGWADFDLRRRLTGHPFPSFAKSFHAEIRTICEFGMPQVKAQGNTCLSNMSWSICWFWDFDALISLILRSKWIHRWQLWVVGCYPHHCWRMVTTSGVDSRKLPCGFQSCLR